MAQMTSSSFMRLLVTSQEIYRFGSKVRNVDRLTNAFIGVAWHFLLNALVKSQPHICMKEE